MKHEVLNSYQDVYVALCGQQFTTHKAELCSSEDAPDPYDGNDIETDY